MQAIGSLIFGRSDNKENNSYVDGDSNPNKLVSFINKNDVISCVSTLKANLPSNAIVISMVGESRRGKSMFLNCMISYLLKENVKAFNFKTNKETNNADCTNGIDYYVYKSKGRENNVEHIFLDVQGLLTTHSAADPHVLLLIYEISDIVIVNIGRSINNGSLQLLTPINSMAHRMSARDVKPKLLFRIYDADEYDDKLATANFNNIFMHKQDQVEGIRNNIKKLFEISDKYIVWTETPNKQQKTTKDLLSLLDDEELLFKDAIEKTFYHISNTKKTYKESFNVKLQAAISEINGLNVGAREFDNVNRYVIDEMLKWLGEYPGDYKHKIDTRLLSEISIRQGTKTEYDNFIEPILRLANKTIEEFKKEFGNTPSDAYHEMLKKLTEKITSFVSKAEQKSIELGKHLIENNPVYQSIIFALCNINIMNNEEFSKNIIEYKKRLNTYLSTYNDNISPAAKKERKKELNTQFTEIEKKFKKEKREYDSKCTEYEESVIQKIKEINKDIIGYISVFVPMLEMNYETLKVMLISDLENKYNLVTMHQDTYGIKTDVKTYKISYVNKIFEMIFINNVSINRYSINCVKIKDLIQQINVDLDDVKSEFTELRNTWIAKNLADYKSNKTTELKVFKTSSGLTGSNDYYDRLSLYNQIKHNDNLLLFRVPLLCRGVCDVPNATRYLVSLQLMGIDIFKIRTDTEVKKLLPTDAYKVYIKAEEYAKNNNLDWLSEQDYSRLLQGETYTLQGQPQYIHLYNLIYTFYQKWFETLACE
jgi:hypothetical protein